MAKKAAAQKVSKTNNSKEVLLPATVNEIDLSIFESKLDFDKILKETENKKLVSVGLISFPGTEFAAGQEIEGFYLGTMSMKNDEGKLYDSVAIRGLNEEKYICSLSKAVEGTKNLPVGSRLKLLYEGDIMTGNGFVMKKVRVSYFK